jgi:hypothetical protein
MKLLWTGKMIFNVIHLRISLFKCLLRVGSRSPPMCFVRHMKYIFCNTVSLCTAKNSKQKIWSSDCRQFGSTHRKKEFYKTRRHCPCLLHAFGLLGHQTSPLATFLWGYVKDTVYRKSLPHDLQELRQRTIIAVTAIEEDLLDKVWQQLK